MRNKLFELLNIAKADRFPLLIEQEPSGKLYIYVHQQHLPVVTDWLNKNGYQNACISFQIVADTTKFEKQQEFKQLTYDKGKIKMRFGG